VSTITTERPDVTATTPEWRRICRFYLGDSQISVCGTARRKPGEDHLDDECIARCHTQCVVCQEMYIAATVGI